MKKSDLYREWARVLDMCEGTNVEPYQCWGYGGFRSTQRHEPSFDETPLEKYEFAVAILEDKPVFVGDTLYHKDHGRPIYVTKAGFDHNYSWNPPKKTFTLNGVELPCAVKKEFDVHVLTIDAGTNYNRKQDFNFLRIEDRDKVADMLIKLLSENTR